VELRRDFAHETAGPDLAQLAIPFFKVNEIRTCPEDSEEFAGPANLGTFVAPKEFCFAVWSPFTRNGHPIIGLMD